MAEERLQKILARAGFGSRRSAEELITTGRVTVNGKVAELGSRADAQRDHISVDGRRLKLSDELVYIAVYKPPGVLSTTAGPDPRSKVTDLVPGGDQLHLVGRLDLDSEGLMLLTNDGELTQQLTHPRYERDKEYRVLVAKHPDQKQLETWRRGVVLPDGVRSEPAEVRFERKHGKGSWLRVIMHEGRKREIREIARTLGLPVAKLIRVRIATLHVGGLKAGDWRRLSAAEVSALKTGVPLPKPAVKTFQRKPYGSKPYGSKPYSSKSSGNKPSDKKPYGAKASGGKPSDKKPYSPKPKRFSKASASGDKPERKPRSTEGRGPKTKRPSSSKAWTSSSPDKRSGKPGGRTGRPDYSAKRPLAARRPAGPRKAGSTRTPKSGSSKPRRPGGRNAR
jgi:23S rRNA pseudouridine2605 synthase